MSGDNEPIIIRKKRSDDEGEHHGGVWKLAFADFMTAMMAFFLVMWLINSTSKETKAVIVQYFNPVQLIDANPSLKGLRDPKEGGQGKSLQNSPNVSDPVKEGRKKTKDDELFEEPMATLDEIAHADPSPVKPNDSLTPRDPFDRLDQFEMRPVERVEGAAPTRQKPPVATSEKADTKIGELQAALDRIVTKEGGRATPHVEVSKINEGILISLTDDADFSMFAVGSVEPRPQLVRIIGEIGKTLTQKMGEIEIRGHTDARSYASVHYDNWRLSADRATMVNYMLIRGGLQPARVGRIVGYADRKLKTPADPLAPANRRIEILLREEGK